jgi:hypothetical protein
MGVSRGRLSQIERGELATFDAVARYLEALGGRLDLVASFGDYTLTLPLPRPPDPHRQASGPAVMTLFCLSRRQEARREVAHAPW